MTYKIRIEMFFSFTLSSILCLSSVAYSKPFEYTYKNEPEKPRNEILPSLVSLILPGADQWYEGQYAAASLYTGYATLGLSTSIYQNSRINELGLETTTSDRMPTNSREQLAMLGAQAFSFAGFMSSYHAFRSGVKTRQHNFNEYKFLETEPDDLLDLATSPVKFQFLSRWTTLLPLGIIAGVTALSINDASPRYQLSPNDGAFATGVSYHAGVGEEAFFRGVVYPYFYQKTDSNLLASFISSGLFAAAHISEDNRYPVIQFAFGTYMDYLTKKNNWSIQESIFIHFWWDVFAIGAALATQDDESNSTAHYLRIIETSY